LEKGLLEEKLNYTNHVGDKLNTNICDIVSIPRGDLCN
jgi:hypothetical protein